MAQLIRLRNDSALPQVLYLRGDAVRVPVGGTILVEPKSYATKVRGFVRVGTVGEPDAPAPTVDTAALLAEIAALKGKLAAQAAEPEVEPEPFPRHVGGGKWELSNGEVTKGGLSREAAETLERDLGA